MSKNWSASRQRERRLLLLVLTLLPVVFIGLVTFRLGTTVFFIVYGFDLSALVILFFILVRVPIRVMALSRTVFPGPAEPLFQMATDIKLWLRVTGGPRTLVSQTGEPGQPGSSYGTEEPGLVLTTTVVSSDPPRKLVTTITGPGILRMDSERTFTPVAEGTLLEVRTRQRMALLTWLVLPVHKRPAKAEAARVSARIRDYLATSAPTASGVAD
jgi:hypothetical protein